MRAPPTRHRRSARGTALGSGLALALAWLPSAAGRSEGLPPWLQLQLGLQAQPMANPSGGRSRSSAWMQQLSLDLFAGPGLAAAPERWREADHWVGHLQLLLFSGDPGYSERLGVPFPLQSTAYPTGLWLGEASLERRMGRGALAVKAGVFSLNPGFVTAPVLNAYVHSALNNTLNLNGEILPISPFIAPGLQLNWRPEPGGGAGEWRGGAFLLGPQDELASVFGVQPGQRSLEGELQLLQWSYDRLPGAGALAAAIQRDSPRGPVPRLLPPPLLQIGAGRVDNRSSGSVDASATASLTMAAPLPLGLDNRLWLGLNGALVGDGQAVPLFLSGGWLSQGVLPSRPRDVLALGVGHSRFRGAAATGVVAGGGDLSQTTVLEANYSWAVSEQLSLQPVLQLILQPGGRDAAPILATGLELNLQF